MTAFLSHRRLQTLVSAILALGLLPGAAAAKQIRDYWIAADEVLWDYAPSFPVNQMSRHTATQERGQRP